MASGSLGCNTKRFFVYDCRDQNNVDKKWINSDGLDFNDFLQDLHQEFGISHHQPFLVTTTDRTVLDFLKFERLPDGITLYLLQNKNQPLPAGVEESIKFMPHYNTLIAAGLYEYYASEGQNPIPYALAELIDNSLSATAKNTGTRTIEIRMMFDEIVGKPAVIVLDNGRGMTPQQLNNWAVYRLSKFTRVNSTFESMQERYVRPDPVPRSLNSDISYFGVGGKQASFYIGTSTRMISKSLGSPDVHELVLSKEDFEEKERKKEDIYSTTIKNRKLCDSSHVNKPNERFLRELIAEEQGKESFTAVVMTGVQADHLKYLKQDFKDWTRRLAHIYHYYIHGVNGNDTRKSSTSRSTNSDLCKIDIQITLREKPPKLPRMINLREVEDDMQTLYINAAADTFEFKASIEQDGGTVEGILRYHPFLYDKETYPKDPSAVQASYNSNDDGDDDDDDDDDEPRIPGRGNRPIFECFWNGRLIPYTRIPDLTWCTRPKGGQLASECYSRFSGVLFTDDKFEVSTNKLTFTDLELKLRKKETMFTFVVNGQKSVRASIQSKFTEWLKNCHATYDKQVKFLGHKGTITREDLKVKKMQHPWQTFSTIKCGEKKFKAGQLIKSKNTNPTYCGKVVRFLLYGEYKEGDFATGGEVELALEPKGLFDKNKIIPISKVDIFATVEAITRIIDSISVKLPQKLQVEWTDGNPWSQNDVHTVGDPLGPLKIEILNMNEEVMTSMPSVGRSAGLKLTVKLRVVHHGPKNVIDVYSVTANHAGKHGFWFKRNANLTKVGNYSLLLNTMINEKTEYGGRKLPSYELKFTFKAGSAESFVIGAAISTVHVGVPFDIALQIKDHYGHATMPPPNVHPVLKCSDIGLKYNTADSSGTTIIVKNVILRGKVQNYQQQKTYNLDVTLPDLKKHTQTMKITLLPGPPHSLHVTPDDNLITVENGNSVKFNVEIHDEAGNITAGPKHIVHCQVQDFPLVTLDCSSMGVGQLETEPIKLKIINGQPQTLKVHLNIPTLANTASVIRELMVIPSNRVSEMKLYSKDDENLVLRNNEKIEWLAGGLLENLFYKLYDEAGREVPLRTEIASRIKVNWTGDLVLEDLVQGKLPDLRVPARVQEERFCQVSYQDQSVSVSFVILPRPDEPTELKATLDHSKVKLGETLSKNITLELVDQYNNTTRTLNSTCVNSMTVTAEDLDQSAVTFIWQESSRSVEVVGVCFQGGAPGPRELCFTYGSYEERVIITLTAGDPVQLKLISGPDQPLKVINDHSIPTPFIVQLLDNWENPSSDQRVVVNVRPSPSVLKVTTAVTSQPVNKEGKACFTVTSVSGPKGYYQLMFTGSLNEKPIPGPSVNLIVLPDPNKPVSLSVDYDTDVKFPAGGTFPLFSVTVVSDEGSPMTTFHPGAIVMFLWEGEPSKENPPTEMKCNRPMENERKDCFYFRDKEIPERAGKYTIQFCLRTQTITLDSKLIIINVVANRPIKLTPDTLPPHPVVSCSKDMANRTLVENMTLRILDAYGNPTGQNLDGTVIVSIKHLSGECDRNLLFENRMNRQCFNLVEGKVHIPRLAIMQDSPGEDGSAYILQFEPEVRMVPVPLEPFELQFHFFNDAANQKKMSALTKKKKDLTTAVLQYSAFFKESQILLDLLTKKHIDENRKISDIRKLLNTKKMILAETNRISDVEKYINEKRTEAEEILKMSRRICTIPDHFRGQQGVLGMVGHLAHVEEDAAAHVISWHLRGDMDCVITRTTESAMSLYEDTGGKQQVMALDSIYVQQGYRPLPHIRNGYNLFHPPGNPVLARDLLIFPENKQECEMVFKNILRDTIVIDDLGSANRYRREVVKNKAPCPTILTRQGDRVNANGKFGGAQSKAPAFGTIHVFGSPPPHHYHALKEQIDLASQYHSALKKFEEAERDLDEHLKIINSPDAIEKTQEMEEKKRELETIEKELAFTTVRPGKRRSQDCGQPSGISSKRAR